MTSEFVCPEVIFFPEVDILLIFKSHRVFKHILFKYMHGQLGVYRLARWITDHKFTGCNNVFV